jgi:hypothetical protein
LSDQAEGHDALLDLLTRRQVLRRASMLAVGALAIPVLPPLPVKVPSLTGPVMVPDATLQAFADTIIPGRKVDRTDLGNSVHPLAIAGVDSRAGAVQTDALLLYHDTELGVEALVPTFLSELETRSLPHGKDFLNLDFGARVEVCLGGLDYGNPSREMWEAAAAVPFIAFCAATLIRNATSAQASGYRVMGLPGPAPNGYSDYSYRRRLSRERTRSGSLP